MSKNIDYLIKQANIKKQQVVDSTMKNKTLTFSDAFKDDIINKVNGSMAIEGMELTEEDKNRIREYAFDINLMNKAVSDLVKKHTVIRE